MKVVRILIFVLLVPALAFAQYKIVLQNGKVIEGKFLHEDEANIYIESNGIQMNFKKETLDLDKMKELNPKVPAPEARQPQKTTSQPSTPKTAVKKPARVYTAEDLKQMKEIWDEGKSNSETEPASGPAVSNQTQEAQAEADDETKPAQTSPTSQDAEPSQPEAPVETPEPAGPRDEKTVRDEITAVNLQIAETEKRIADLSSKGRVTGTWDKLLVKQKQHAADLQQELKDMVAARKAAQKTAESQ